MTSGTSPERRRRILVVDDDSQMREMVRRMLEEADYGVEAAGSGYRGIVNAHNSGPFDAILLDLKMPGIDGLSAIEHLKEQQPGVPIIIITGSQDQNLHQEACQQGAKSVVQKPFGPQELYDALDRAWSCAE